MMNESEGSRVAPSSDLRSAALQLTRIGVIGPLIQSLRSILRFRRLGRVSLLLPAPHDRGCYDP